MVGSCGLLIGFTLAVDVNSRRLISEPEACGRPDMQPQRSHRRLTKTWCGGPDARAALRGNLLRGASRDRLFSGHPNARRCRHNRAHIAEPHLQRPGGELDHPTLPDGRAHPCAGRVVPRLADLRRQRAAEGGGPRVGGREAGLPGAMARPGAPRMDHARLQRRRRGSPGGARGALPGCRRGGGRGRRDHGPSW
jgi:hypothetical protein